MKKLKHALTYSARVIIGLIAGLMIAVTSSAETLMVYTAVEAEDLKRYAAAFNEDHPDIKNTLGTRFYWNCYRKTACGKKQSKSRCNMGISCNKFNAASIRRDAAGLCTERIE